MATANLHLIDQALSPEQHRHLYELASKLYSDAHPRNDRALLQEAAYLARQANSARPDYIPGINLLCRIELRRSRLHQARQWVTQGLAVKPDSVSLLYSAGHVELTAGDLDAAEQYFEQAAKISRSATKAAHYLAHVKLLKGEYVAAFQQFRELARTGHPSRTLRSQLFDAAAHIVADFYAEEMEQDLLRFLDFNDVDYSQLRPLATSLLRHKLKLSEAGCPLALDNIANDPLLLRCLECFYFTDPVFERLFVTLRQTLLFSSSRSLAIAEPMLPLVSALAHQCWLNEGVSYISDSEEQLLQQLDQLSQRMLASDALEGPDLYPVLILQWMYRPASQCQHFATLQQRQLQHWPHWLQQHWQQQVEEPLQLTRIAAQLPSIGMLSDRTTAAVKAQYDQHPYPRWRDIGYNQPSHYWSALEATFPSQLAGLNQRPGPIQALVAGCGTGRHAIRLAHYFYQMQVTALDISHSALAYAKRQAEHYGERHIDFVQGDLLAVERLGQQFDLIECSGVLHHMQQPEMGLKALAQQLRPNGFIKVALYSRTARRAVTQLRQHLAEQRPQNNQDIRLVREALLQQAIEGDWHSLIQSPDFYSLSACRDLLFHTQELVFDLSQLLQLAEQTQLEWVGLIPPPSAESLAQRHFGCHAHQLTLSQWQQLEQQQPQLFAGMYQFYLHKPAQPTLAGM
ncbi:hypothetical protein GCM10011297_10900 [Bacterioplanes sanyensis]|uniref:class I SAM-dependent methyltransferase n=1 Tax=Bacterioplanes sanyensis TaxID=1249553 RepID=UPI00167C2F89|nr:class I SAM-dependent methyltransferase [Bacterioplanes sanyensis]GGY39515.1 hypothetical protein GCM10011297_10900 [Bacterioplanes sanyensis]